jgi:hypothetical protein
MQPTFLSQKCSFFKVLASAILLLYHIITKFSKGMTNIEREVITLQTFSPSTGDLLSPANREVTKPLKL